VRLTSRGPVLFRQARIGRNGRQFWMLKFRTMHVERSDVSPASLEGEVVAGPFVKLKRDPRITPLGRFLRHTSLDELPQLWNVLRGEMSLVGPRPFMLEDAAIIEGWALRRYSVRPGITGLWQVSGRNELTVAEMCRLDQLYVNCWSLGLDVRILLRTLWVVLGGHGAY
jgi:lipopolysaccharide/colanic/teichoic acid biosynthesis glycosyltransferase